MSPDTSRAYVINPLASLPALIGEIAGRAAQSMASAYIASQSADSEDATHLMLSIVRDMEAVTELARECGDRFHAQAAMMDEGPPANTGQQAQAGGAA